MTNRALAQVFLEDYDAHTGGANAATLTVLLDEAEARGAEREREACVVAVRAVIVDPQDYYASVDAIRKRGTP